MSQSFNLSRFGRLFSKHTAEHFGGYLMATAVLLGGIGLVLGFVAYMSTGPFFPDMQAVIFVMGLLAAGAFFTSTVFAPFGDKRQATAALMLPASHWEKYLVGWLYAVPLFLATYVGCFFLMDAIVLQIDSVFSPEAPLVQLFSNESHLYFSLPVYAVVSSVFLWGSIFFTKQHFVRTAFGLLVGAVVLSLVNFQVMKAMLGNTLYKLTSAVPFSGITFRTGNAAYSEYHAVSLPSTHNSWFLLVPLAIVLLAWAAAYLRVTEKQV